MTRFREEKSAHLCHSLSLSFQPTNPHDNDQVQGKEISALVSFSGGFVATWGNLAVHVIEQLPMVSIILLPIIIIVITGIISSVSIFVTIFFTFVVREGLKKTSHLNQINSFCPEKMVEMA